MKQCRHMHIKFEISVVVQDKIIKASLSVAPFNKRQFKQIHVRHKKSVIKDMKETQAIIKVT